MAPAFPNVGVVLHLYLWLYISAERTFFANETNTNELRSTTGRNRMNFLSLMLIECEILRKRDLSSINFIHQAKKIRKGDILRVRSVECQDFFRFHSSCISCIEWAPGAVLYALEQTQLPLACSARPGICKCVFLLWGKRSDRYRRCLPWTHAAYFRRQLA